MDPSPWHTCTSNAGRTVCMHLFPHHLPSFKPSVGCEAAQGSLQSHPMEKQCDFFGTGKLYVIHVEHFQRSEGVQHPASCGAEGQNL